MSLGSKIRDLRHQKALSRESLASAADVTPDTIREIEKGIRTKPHLTTLRKIADALEVEAAILTRYVSRAQRDESPRGRAGLQSQIAVHESILALTLDPATRVADYRRCLEIASGEIFISGTSMISLSEDSADLLGKKVVDGSEVKLLIADPDWLEASPGILTFIQEEERRRIFHLEIRNSIGKLESVKRELPEDLRSRFIMRTYRSFFPYIVTGFVDGHSGQAIVEITDYLPERFRPRFTLENRGEECFFGMVYDKFCSLWASSLTDEVF